MASFMHQLQRPRLYVQKNKKSFHNTFTEGE